jgi:hypothetical protein
MLYFLWQPYWTSAPRLRALVFDSKSLAFLLLVLDLFLMLKVISLHTHSSWMACRLLAPRPLWRLAVFAVLIRQIVILLLYLGRP